MSNAYPLFFFNFVFIGKLHTDLSPSTKHLQGEEVPIELEFIGNNAYPLYLNQEGGWVKIKNKKTIFFKSIQQPLQKAPEWPTLIEDEA